MTSGILSIYPDPPHPYYIVTPPYLVTSAGIRCLHLLCHSLNVNGQTAYILSDPPNITAKFKTGTDFITPHLMAEIAMDHFAKGKCPIVVYPEIVAGNPYNAGCIIRYVLNFPGVLGGDHSYGDDELVFSFSKTLAEDSGAPLNVLHFPLIDTRIFKLPPSGTVRRGTCFYAAKFKNVHGGVPGHITSDSVEITRDELNSQTSEEVAHILQTSELFYTYENTTLAIEAVLCGCAAVFIPNPFLDKIIASEELSRDGFAWGTEPAEVARAKASVDQGILNYQRSVEGFSRQLDHFVYSTQEHARLHGKIRKIDIPHLHFVHYDTIFQAVLFEFSRKLPIKWEREFAKFLSTFGFKKLASIMWNNAAARSRNRSMHRDFGKTVFRIKSRLPQS